MHWCVKPGKHIAVTRPNGGLSCTTSVGLGMSGAYPGPGSFMISARGTNLPALIETGETPRDARELLELIDAGKLEVENLEIWKTDCPELALKDNDLFVDAAGSSGGWGDPLDRDPALMINDLNDGMAPRYEFTANLYGIVATVDAADVWTLDAGATAARRAAMRQARIGDSQTAQAWWASERTRVLARDFIPEVREMYEQSMSFGKFDNEFRKFWQVPAAFNFPKE